MKARTLILPRSAAVAILISLAIVELASTEMQRIKATAARITEDTLPSTYLSGELQSVSLLRYTLLADYVDSKDNAERADLDKQFDSANIKIDYFMGRCESLIDSPTDRQLFEALKSTRKPYDECYISLLRLNCKGEIEEAQNLIGTQLTPLCNAS